MSGHARRSRLVALGLSLAALGGLVTAMVATEHPRRAPAAEGPAMAVPDPFTAGRPATPPSSAPGSRFRQTITSAS
jgi:hypothetical protein